MEEGVWVRMKDGAWLLAWIRHAQRFAMGLIPVMGVTFLFSLPMRLGMVVWREQYALALLFLGLIATFLSGRRLLDLAFALVTLLVGAYSILEYPNFLARGEPSATHIAVALAAFLLLLEGSRRVLGLAMPLILLALGAWAVLIRGTDAALLLTHLHSAPDAIPGTPLQITGIEVLPFVLMGAVLELMGAGAFFVDLARSLVGRIPGGSAQVCILSSAFFGTINGSAVANVASSGVFTIPLMRREGFRPETAAAVEAVSSTGGQFTPPVMGAAAFLMADFLGVPYSKIVLAAAIPALLFYAACMIQIGLEAMAKNIRPPSDERIPGIAEVLRQGWLYLVPIAVLLYLLFRSPLSVGQVGLVATASCLVVALLRMPRELFRKSVAALEEAGKSLLPVLVATGAAGAIMGVFSLTGAAFSVTTTLGKLAVSPVTALALVASVALLLGTGLPTTAAYIVMATTMAPILYHFGFEPLASHLFLLYFSMMSMVTPPVCVAAYTAAGIAGTSFWRTGLESVRLAIAGYLVPLAFINEPALLLQAGWEEVVSATLRVLLALLAISCGYVGYAARPLNIVERLAMVAAGFVAVLSHHELLRAGSMAAIVVLLALRWAMARVVPVARRGLIGSQQR